MKRVLRIFIAVLLLTSCDELEGQSNSQIRSSISTSYHSSVLVNKRNEMEDYVFRALTKAKAIDMTTRVRTHMGNDYIDVLFYYVSSDNGTLNNFEMAMQTFLSYVKNGTVQNHYLISESYYHQHMFYFNILNTNNGEFDGYRAAIDPSMNLEDFVDFQFANLLYGATQSNIFSVITEEMLEQAKFSIGDMYELEVKANEANIKRIKLSLDQKEIYIESSELDKENRLIEEEIKLIPKFDEGIDITDFSDMTYELISLERLIQIITLEPED